MKSLNTYLLILLVIFNFFLSFGVNKVSAEDKWYFKDKGDVVQGPYTTKEICEEVLKNSEGKTLCYKEGEIPATLNAEQNKPSDTNTYNLLAPLPGLKSIETNDIGKYFNIVFNIAIGICGVLAVIMLVIHGISYMTSESFTEKAELKKKIWGPIGGLLLALGSYAILNTIDPALTGKEGLSVDQVSAQIEQDLALYQAGYSPADVKNLTPQQIKDIVVSYRGKFAYIKNEYIPARDKAIVGASKGALTLMTAQAAFEGYYPGARSYRTNNPGNIGNTESGSNGFPTLEAGIKKQYEHLTKIANNNNPYYKIGNRVKAGPIKEAGVTYPGIDIIYNGTLEHYLWTYAAGTRPPKDGISYPGYNNYISYIISFFKKEGMTIGPQTTIKQIYSLSS